MSDLLRKERVDSLDISLQTYEKAMGIEDVRKIQKAILLKPFRGKTKAVIIDAYENITLEAQNALLKILEEPPANTIIVITVAKREFILPTIISRCKVIVLQEKETELTQDDLSKFNDVLNILLNGKTGNKLKIAQDLAKDKENLISWFGKMTIFVKNKLMEDNGNYKYLNFLKELQKTYKTIESTNVSQRAALENLFLSF
jgi:DNA polymerase III gamma/tau subunit